MRTDVQSGYYGTLVYDKKNKCDIFVPCGREITLNRIYQSIEDNYYEFEIKYDYGVEQKTYYISRGVLEDPSRCKELADAGMQVKRKQYDVFAHDIYRQENLYLLDNITPNYCYKNLGWTQTNVFSEDKSFEWCYRSTSIITPVHSTFGKYLGRFKIAPMGDIEVWLSMVTEHVLPYIPMSLVLLASLSSLVIPLLSTVYPIGNGILHLCAVSSSGKTTAAYLATSVAGEPFSVVKTEYDTNSRIIEQMSLLQSFSATENALLGKLTGFNGAPIVIDELGKYQGRDLKGFIYDIFDGSSKARMSKDLEVSEILGFKGSIITTGETSILGKCPDKLEGLNTRVLEIKTALTTSAEHSDIIKKVCKNNNGWIAPKLATYILKNGDVSMLSTIYAKWVNRLRNELPKVKFIEKFIANFPAVYLTTAEVAKEALGLEFNLDSIIKFFVDYLSNEENSMDVSIKSYDYLMQEFSANSKRFYQIAGSNEIDTNGEVWGRYYKVSNSRNIHNRRIVGEYAVRQNIVDMLLKKENFTLKQCVDSWKELDLINYEEKHNCRRRKIDVTKEKEYIYVFYVFDDNDTLISDNKEGEIKRAKSSQLLQLLDPTDDCEDS